MECKRDRPRRGFGERKPAARNEIYRWVQLMARRPDGQIVRGDFVQLSDGNAFVEWYQEFNGVDVFHSICVYAERDCRARYVVSLYARIRSQRGIDVAKRAAQAVHEHVL
jgi:hypothetical protein